jgi:predicted nucleic acid-binding protein
LTESVYLETTFISYLVGRPSRDLLVAGHQQATQDWWTNRRGDFDCYVSQVVIDEASSGDPDEIQKRMTVIANLPVLEVTQDAESLTHAILAIGVIPPRALRDAAHIAVAAVHEVDYLLTWNCKHLANAQITRRIAMTCDRLGYRMPIICTPEELMGE